MDTLDGPCVLIGVRACVRVRVRQPPRDRPKHDSDSRAVSRTLDARVPQQSEGWPAEGLGFRV